MLKTQTSPPATDRRIGHSGLVRPAGLGLGEWPGWLLCIALVAPWLGATAWLRPLAIPDEGRYVGVAWEMLRSGDWLVPTLDGLPFFHKPPLFYWITAASMKLLGPGAMAARGAAWLASIAATTALFMFVRRWVGLVEAWAAVVALVTTPLFYGAAQYANTDMLVAGCISVTVLSAADALLARTRGLRFAGALATAFAAAGLGVLAKGLIGAVLPVLLLAAWGLATRRFGKVVSLLMWPMGWILFTAIVAPWFIAMQHRFPEFAHYFFVVQHFQRFSVAGFNNAQPWWFYPAVLVALTFPWSLRLTAMVDRRHWERNDRRDVRILMLMWVGVVTTFFSLPSSKLVGYILPALPPLAFLIADVCRPLLDGRAPGDAARARPLLTSNLLLRATCVLATTGCVALAVAAHFYQPKSHRLLAEELQASRGEGDPVLFMGNYYYDVGFYARIDEPILVVDEWQKEEVEKDSWRRELVDAARFAPSGSSRRLLVLEEAEPILCRAPSSWLVGRWPPSAMPPWLAVEPPYYQSGDTALWHIAPNSSSVRSHLRCNDAPARRADSGP